MHKLSHATGTSACVHAYVRRHQLEAAARSLFAYTGCLMRKAFMAWMQCTETQISMRNKVSYVMLRWVRKTCVSIDQHYLQMCLVCQAGVRRVQDADPAGLCACEAACRPVVVRLAGC